MGKLKQLLKLEEAPDPDGTSAGLTDLTEEEREKEFKKAPKVSLEDPEDDD